MNQRAMHLCAAACGVIAAASALAQAPYPAKPVRMVVPSSAGGGTDIVARIVAPRLSERLGQQVVIDNRPGAGTMIGNELVARAVGDGYTILMGLSTLATNPIMHKKVPYNALTDFAPITLVLSAPNVLVVHPSLPVKTVKELIAFAKARPGQVNYGSAGLGTNPHLGMELFLSMAGLTMTHIPYKGSAPAMIDLISGQVVTMTATMLTGMPHIRTGRLRPLGITGSQRNAALPDVPTVAEAGVPGYETVLWYGALAPATTSKDIVARLHRDLTAVLRSAEVKERFAADGGEAVGNSSEEFASYIRSELEKWARVAKAAGIKPE